MEFLRRWLGRETRSRSPGERIGSAMCEQRRRYAELRASTAGCLYVVHKLRGEVVRQEALAAAARDAARLALAAEDIVRSRAMVARARTALDLAREAESHRADLRVDAEAALEGLRSLGEAIGDLERERLRALVARAAAPAASAELDEARRALEVLEAERELELELG